MTGDQLLVIGDVHGEVDKLAQVFDTLGDGQSRIVTVGDYINRGPASKDVLDLLLFHRKRLGERLILLRGNHEEALLNFLDGGRVEDYVAHGGLATIRSYPHHDLADPMRSFKMKFPSRHRDLLELMGVVYIDDENLISHAGFDTRKPHDLTSRMLIHGDKSIFDHRGPWLRPTTVFGHFVQPSGRPRITDQFICLDTGCGTIPGRPLTAVRLPTRDIFQF